MPDRELDFGGPGRWLEGRETQLLAARLERVQLLAGAAVLETISLSVLHASPQAPGWWRDGLFLFALVIVAAGMWVISTSRPIAEDRRRISDARDAEERFARLADAAEVPVIHSIRADNGRAVPHLAITADGEYAVFHLARTGPITRAGKSSIKVGGSDLRRPLKRATQTLASTDLAVDGIVFVTADHDPDSPEASTERNGLEVTVVSCDRAELWLQERAPSPPTGVPGNALARVIQ